jgi:hypothetical protein
MAKERGMPKRVDIGDSGAKLQWVKGESWKCGMGRATMGDNVWQGDSYREDQGKKQ